MFILSSISGSLEFWSVNNIYENSEFNVFKNINTFGQVFSNWLNDLVESKVYKVLESCW